MKTKVELTFREAGQILAGYLFEQNKLKDQNVDIDWFWDGKTLDGSTVTFTQD